MLSIYSSCSLSDGTVCGSNRADLLLANHLARNAESFIGLSLLKTIFNTDKYVACYWKIYSKGPSSTTHVTALLFLHVIIPCIFQSFFNLLQISYRCSKNTSTHDIPTYLQSERNFNNSAINCNLNKPQGWCVSVRGFKSVPQVAKSMTTEGNSKDEQTYEEKLHGANAYLIPHKYWSRNSEFKTIKKRVVCKLFPLRETR
jgi:hypothetical protein